MLGPVQFYKDLLDAKYNEKTWYQYHRQGDKDVLFFILFLKRLIMSTLFPVNALIPSLVTLAILFHDKAFFHTTHGPFR